MRAIALHGYGSLDNLKLTELAAREPKSGEVRVKVHCSALNPSDYKTALGEVKFLHSRKMPMVLGYDFSGVIEAIGTNANEFKVGQAVFGFLAYSISNRQGAFGESLVARVDQIALKPDRVSHTQAAAAATPALTALQALRDSANLKKEARVFINGVSGGVGSTGVWIARKLGAAQVVATGSSRGLEIAKKLGATSVIDRKSQDPLTAGKFDIVFDAAAAFRWRQWQTNLNSGGTYITTLPSAAFLVDKLKSFFTNSRAAMVMVKSQASDLQLLANWLENDLEISIDSTVPVRDVVQALKRYQKGDFSGRIVVDVINGF